MKPKKVKFNKLSWEDCEPNGIVIIVKCRHSRGIRIYSHIKTVKELKDVGV